MAFEYTPYTNRYAGAIAGSLREMGTVRARAALQVADAQARATQARGDVWGQAIGSIPAQMQQAKAQQQQLQMRAMELEQAKQEQVARAAKQQDVSALDQAFSPAAALSQGGQGPMPQNAPMPDRQTILNALPGHLQPVAQKHFAEIDEAKKKDRETRNDYWASLAAGVHAFGNDPQAAMMAIQDAAEDYPQQAKELTDLIRQNPSPEFIGQLTSSLMVKSPKYAEQLRKDTPKLAERDPTKDLYNPQTGAIVTPGTPAVPKAETRSLDVQAAEALAKGDTDTYNRLLKVKKEMGQADDRPRITVNTGANASAPGDWDKTGEDFLKTVPAQWRMVVKKIANYEMDPTKVASMRGGMREALSQWVSQVNPAYDTTMYANRAPTRKAFTTGTQGQQINAINTAIGHIDQLTSLASGMNSSDFVPGNRAFNALRTLFGGEQVTNFDTLKDALAGEVASVLSKGAGTVSGIAEAKEKINAANFPAQLAGYVKTLIPVMGSKLASLDYQYHQAMGENDTFSALSPDVKGILTKHGFDPAHPTVTGTAPQEVKVGGFTVKVK